MEVLTYVPSNVSLIVGGYQIQGWTSISLERNSPAFKQIRGIRGKNTRTRMHDYSCTLTIECPHTELLNDILSMVVQADRANGTARLEIALMESTGTSFFTTSTAYIVSEPPLVRTADVSTVRWTLICEDCQLFVGSAKNAAVGAIEGGIARLKDFVSDIGSQVANIGDNFI